MTDLHAQLRPQELHAQYQQLQIATLASLFAGAEGWPVRPCPLCGATTHALVVDRGNRRYVRCASCSLVFLHALPPLAAIQDYYQRSAASSFFHEHILAVSEAGRRDRVFRPRLARLAEFGVKNPGKLLDVGCSIGTFVDLARENGWQAVGYELNAKAVAVAHGHARAVFSSWPEVELAVSPPFHVITAWEVIAHLETPQIQVAEYLQRLRPGGVFILTTPNVEALEYQVLGDSHSNFDFPFLQFFSVHTIRRLLDSVGARLVHIETPGQMDVETIRNHYIGNKTDLTPPFIELFLSDTPTAQQFRQAFQQALVASHASGHMLVVATVD